MVATRKQNLQVVKYRYYRVPFFRSQISAIAMSRSPEIFEPRYYRYGIVQTIECQCHQSGKHRRKIDLGFDRETKL
jgi:hypothetical protein